MSEERTLKPANENAWYVLMTLYGEQEGEEIDWALHQRNLGVWNLAVGCILGDSVRDALAKISVSLPQRDLWHREGDRIRKLHEQAWRQRNEGYAYYPGFPDIAQIRFIGIRLDNLEFRHHLVAVGFAFASDFSCRHSLFKRSSNFESCAMVGHCDFRGARFVGVCNFHQTFFGGDAEFNDTMLQGPAIFRAAQFDGTALFQAAAFGAAVDFESTRFNGDADLSSASFRSDASFSHSSFSKDLIFHHAEFSGEVWLNGVIFSANVWLQGANFTRLVSFESSTFTGDARFDDAIFQGGADFRAVNFNGFASFANVRFGAPGGRHAISFEDCYFRKPSNFRGTQFIVSYPDFSGTVLHDKTTFTAKPGFWPQGLQSDPERAKASCAVIRHNLGRQGLPEEEHFFFRREMGFAAQIGGWWQRLPYRVFGAVSDFGYSIQWPALWMLGLFIGGAMINHVVLRWGATLRGAEYHPAQAFALSFANQFPLFGLHLRWFSAEYLRDLNPWLKALGGLQTVLSLPLLFFLGLGLRTRFRMR